MQHSIVQSISYRSLGVPSETVYAPGREPEAPPVVWTCKWCGQRAVNCDEAMRTATCCDRAWYVAEDVR